MENISANLASLDGIDIEMIKKECSKMKKSDLCEMFGELLTNLQELNEENERLKDKENEMNYVMKNEEKLKSTVDKLNKEVFNNEDKIYVLTDEKVKLEIELEKCKLELFTSKKRIRSLEKELEKENESMNRNTNENSNLKELKKSLDNATKLRALLDECEEDKKIIKRELKDSEAGRKKLEKDFSKLNKEKIKTEDQLRIKSNKAKDIEPVVKENKDLKIRITQLNKEIKQMNKLYSKENNFKQSNCKIVHNKDVNDENLRNAKNNFNFGEFLK